MLTANANNQSAVMTNLSLVSKNGQEIFEKINFKRARNEDKYSEFGRSFNKMIESVSEKYQRYSETVAHKIQHIYEELEQVEILERELNNIMAQIEFLQNAIAGSIGENKIQ